MKLLSVIRRWLYRDHFSLREIARRTGLSRNTVRKYLRQDSVEPRFNIAGRPSKLDPYAEKLSAMLCVETGKSRKQKRTIRQLHVDLVGLGYGGSYNRVAAFARDWKDAQQREQQTSGGGTFVPLAFVPGEAFQFDWSQDWAIIAGERTKLQVAHVKLSYSRAFTLRAYPLQTHEMLFDAHNHAFRVLGGVPQRGISDNMKTAVDKVGRGKQRQVNIRFSAMVGHFGGARAGQPGHLPRETIAHEGPCACPACGSQRLRKIADDQREVLEYVPSHLKVLVHVRPKLSCRDCEIISQPPMPSLPIEGGRPT